MNRIGFLELHRPKTPTERLEAVAARRAEESEETVAISSFVFAEQEAEEDYCKACGQAVKRG